MKPAVFEYFAPSSVDETIALLAAGDKDVRILAGGQSLMPMMNFRLTSPEVILDINNIAALNFIDDAGTVIRIGAMTRQRTLEFSPIIAERLPLLRDAVKLVGHLPTRTRGTIGGSLVQADPSAELPLLACLLDAELFVQGPAGERAIKASAFFQSLMTTDLASDEMLTRIELPAMAPGAGYAIEEFARRSGDFAIAAIAVLLHPASGSKAGREIQLAVGGVGPIPVRLRRSEELIAREGLSDDVIARAGKLASEDVEPMSDHNASAAYRRHLTSELLVRAVRTAKTRCNVS